MSPEVKPEVSDVWSDIEDQRKKDMDLAAKLVWSENTKPTPEEAALIIDSARNRMRQRRLSLQEVLNEPKQYAGFSPENPRFADVEGFGPGHPFYKDIRAMVEQAYDPKRKPSTTTHYYLTTRKGGPPEWARHLTNTRTVGAHTFGTLPGGR